MTNARSTDPTRSRTGLRLLGVLLLLAGAAAVVAGAVVFARGSLADDLDTLGRNALIGVLVFGAGGLLLMGAAGTLRAGFHRERRFVATGPLPAVGDRTGLLAADDRPVE